MMKTRCFLLFVAFGLSIQLNAVLAMPCGDLGQGKQSGNKETTDSKTVMPQFPGGDTELYRFIMNNLNYPAIAIENNIQGRVVVDVMVKKNGSVGEVKIVRSVDRDLDSEAMRICKRLPKFKPGTLNGRPVDCWLSVPITFRLSGN